MAATERGRVITGARARLSINNTVVGWARRVTVNEEIEYQPAEILDNIEVQEWIPIRYRVTVNAERIKISGLTLKTQGLFPLTGGGPDEHLQNILLAGDLTIQVEDTKSPGRILAVVEECKVTSNNYTIDSNGITGEDINFVCTRVRDEAEAA